MVFLIAGIPALAVLITYYITDSKAKTTVAALIAAAIGVFTGNPIYALLDLALVGGAYWIAMSNLNDDEKARLETVARLRRVEEMERSRAGTDLVDDPVPGWEERSAEAYAADAQRNLANAVKLAALRARIEADRDSATDVERDWVDRCAAMDAALEVRVQANKAKVAALLAKMEAERSAAIETVPTLPVKAKRQARRTGEAVEREYAEGARAEFDAGSESLSEGRYARCAELQEKPSIPPTGGLSAPKGRRSNL